MKINERKLPICLQAPFEDFMVEGKVVTGIGFGATGEKIHPRYLSEVGFKVRVLMSFIIKN